MGSDASKCQERRRVERNNDLGHCNGILPTVTRSVELLYFYRFCLISLSTEGEKAEMVEAQGENLEKEAFFRSLS